jgi:hypothetical protein
LKFLELLNHFRFEFEKINLSKFTIIIQKAYIVFVSTNRLRSRTPDMRKYKFYRMARHTSRLGIGKLMTICLLTRTTNIIFI